MFEGLWLFLLVEAEGTRGFNLWFHASGLPYSSAMILSTSSMTGLSVIVSEGDTGALVRDTERGGGGG